MQQVAEFFTIENEFLDVFYPSAEFDYLHGEPSGLYGWSWPASWLILAEVPDCEKTDRNAPTRRAKLSYLLSRHGVRSKELADAADADINNVLSLFRTFNDGTHGHAGRFTITELTAIRTRVESAIRFIYEVVSVPRTA